MNKLKVLLDKLGLSLLVFKTALAASISWFVAIELSDNPYPYFAPLAAILTVQVTVADSLQKAIQRLTGIIGGVIVSLVITQWLPIGTLSIFLVILIGMAVSKALKLHAYIISQVAVSSFLVLLSSNNQGYVFGRIFETILGSSIAVVINALIIPQKVVAPIKANITSTCELASNTLRALLPLFTKVDATQETAFPEINKLVEKTNGLMQSFQTAQQGIKYTPFLVGVKSRLAELAKVINNLEYITVQLRGIRRAMADLYATGQNEIDAVYEGRLQNALEATALCIKAYGVAAVEPSAENKKRLFEAIEAAKVLQQETLSCLTNIRSLITLRDAGSILTDLSRILKEVSMI